MCKRQPTDLLAGSRNLRRLETAVGLDPVHAALPWAGVRFILLVRRYTPRLCSNLQRAKFNKFNAAAAIVGIERFAVLIGRCTIYEQLYLTDDAPKNAEEATENLRRLFS